MIISTTLSHREDACWIFTYDTESDQVVFIAIQYGLNPRHSPNRRAIVFSHIGGVSVHSFFTLDDLHAFALDSLHANEGSFALINFHSEGELYRYENGVEESITLEEFSDYINELVDIEFSDIPEQFTPQNITDNIDQPSYADKPDMPNRDSGFDLLSILTLSLDDVDFFERPWPAGTIVGNDFRVRRGFSVHNHGLQVYTRGRHGDPQRIIGLRVDNPQLSDEIAYFHFGGIDFSLTRDDIVSVWGQPRYSGIISREASWLYGLSWYYFVADVYPERPEASRAIQLYFDANGALERVSMGHEAINRDSLNHGTPRR